MSFLQYTITQKNYLKIIAIAYSALKFPGWDENFENVYFIGYSICIKGNCRNCKA